MFPHADAIGLGRAGEILLIVLVPWVAEDLAQRLADVVLVPGYRVSQCLYARLGVGELLAEERCWRSLFHDPLRCGTRRGDLVVRHRLQARRDGCEQHLLWGRGLHELGVGHSFVSPSWRITSSSSLPDR